MVLELAWLLGVLTLALLSPGPDFLLVLKNSLGGTRARALATALGITCGVAVQMLLIFAGLAATPPSVLRWVQLVGALVLATLGLRALLTPTAKASVSTGSTPRSAHNAFLEGLLCNITNPKAFVFFVSLLAQIIRPESTTVWRIVVPAVIVIHGLVVWCLIALALQSPVVARRLGRAQHWLPRAFGGALVLVASVVLWETLR